MPVFALASEHRWSCPRCVATTVTHDGALPMHVCAGMRGLTAPMTPHGVSCKVEALEREDYLAGEMTQTDSEGRPIMSVLTTRDDGTDLAVLAPCAAMAMGAGT